MADAVLDTLPADGKLPAQLGANPDRELADAWVRENGGKVDFYWLTGTDGSRVAERAGHVFCAAPSIGYGGRKIYAVPQLRSIADEQQRAEYEKRQQPKEAEQPDWNWNPQDPSVADVVVPHQQTQAERDAIKAELKKQKDEFDANMANIWVPNPEDLNPVIKARPPRPVPDASGNPGMVSERDPWSGKWTVRGQSGIEVSSDLSRDDAVARWNVAVEAQKKAIEDAVAAAAGPKP
ncbi:hypothetical protein N7563_22040 [Leclercia adecarboxylata ATCC 23216 = NBRC 102595]|nr:hypothetical protein [Leclercia adecarboxylata ATCC 23216 = NBRC 102595]